MAKPAVARRAKAGGTGWIEASQHSCQIEVYQTGRPGIQVIDLSFRFDAVVRVTHTSSPKPFRFAGRTCTGGTGWT